MPREVATELLCTGTLRTNRERKVARLARSKVWESTQERKPVAKKLAARFAGRSLVCLTTWHQRAERKYIHIQHKYQKVSSAISEVPGREDITAEQRKAVVRMLEREQAKLMLIGTQVELFLTEIESAIKQRGEAPKRRENLAKVIFESMVIDWHKLVGVELHFDPRSLMA